MSDAKSFINLLDEKLNSSCRQTRVNIANMARSNLFTPIYNLSLEQERELSLRRLQMLADTKTVSVTDFLTNPDNIFTTHEMLAYIDGSLTTKFTVQFNLFGGSLIALAGEQHKYIFDEIDSLKSIGCFCLTEVGYGNNAVEMETTAVLQEDGSFVIHCPTVNSQKFWITNGAVHANHALVFAQTYVKGKHEGIQVFLVKIRNERGEPLPGVSIDDMGMKMGMNGIDNARIIFNNFKADKSSMMPRYSQLDAQNNLVSEISKKRDRFLAVANRLLSGRICISSMTLSGAKQALLITAKYGVDRLSNGPSGKSDYPIANYQLFQNQIVPLICSSYVYNLGMLEVRRNYCEFLLKNQEGDKAKMNEIIRTACMIKPLIAWKARDIANICRERTGGQGFLSINRFGEGIAAAHAAITAEGDSAVLITKVSKEYVEDVLKGRIEAPKNELGAEHIVAQKSVFTYELLRNLLAEYEVALLNDLTEKTVNGGIKNVFNIWMLQESDTIQELGKTFGERYCVEEAHRQIWNKQ